MPGRLIALFATAALVAAPSAWAAPTGFDVVAHQGGPAGTGTGESLPAFANALEIGVSTLELDIGITRDRQPVVWHDEFVDPRENARIPDPLSPLIRNIPTAASSCMISRWLNFEH